MVKSGSQLPVFVRTDIGCQRLDRHGRDWALWGARGKIPPFHPQQVASNGDYAIRAVAVRPACPESWRSASEWAGGPSTNHPRATGNRGSLAVNAGYTKQGLNRTDEKPRWSENHGDRTYKEGVGGSSPSAPTRIVEEPAHFVALEAVGKCLCRALSLIIPSVATDAAQRPVGGPSQG